MKKAGFPSRPELLSDVPPEQLETNFVPGTDQLYDNIIQGEREEEDDNDNNDSLSFISAGHQSEPEKEEEEEERVTMAPSKKFASSREPNKQPGQCEVSWELLHPIIATVDVEDPSMKRRRGHLTRKGYVIHVDIPAGVVPASFVQVLES